MLIVKKTLDIEFSIPISLLDPGYFSYAFNPKLTFHLVGGRQEKLNANCDANGRTSAAHHKRAVQRHIFRKAAFRLFATVHPMKEYG